ncbi:flagellar motor protein MotA [Terrihabitans sp. B22-R8]|uniref:flagellar motor protein MotA n=1 Tax=Terrihabitans sp. B22-R8 TaxID=3425128 RepID=UPI00403C8E95
MSVAEFDPYKLSSPRVFLLRMVVFLVLAAFVALVLYEQIFRAFMANPGLNGLIFGVLFIGIGLAFRQAVRLFPEVRWVNDFRVSDPGLALRDAPVLLAPMASLLGNRLGRASISTSTLRSILDSLSTRLDEARDIGRYLTGLLVFLGLLGTFWGLLETVSSVGGVIGGLQVEGDAGVIFEDLKRGLGEPLSGMGIAFSSSLFGLAGSLVLGFLDLQAGQAQNRFYNELEDWLSGTVADARIGDEDGLEFNGNGNADVAAALNRLANLLGQDESRDAAGMGRLTEGVQGLIQHLRAEQALIRDWMQRQAVQTEELRRLIAERQSDRAG